MREARDQLEEQKQGLDQICFPVLLRLSEVAAALVDEAALRNLLFQTRCVHALPVALVDAERAAAAIIKALIEHNSLLVSLAPYVWERLLSAPVTPPQVSGEKTGRVYPPLLCLDAWDEVRDGRKNLAACLRSFGRLTSARIFLTSRITGYVNPPLPVERDPQSRRQELRICPFERPDTEQFSTAFFGAGSELAKRMLSELREKIAVAGMAQNPLLTTLLCMAFAPHPDQAPLNFPATRTEV
jgi:hypothetical protein